MFGEVDIVCLIFNIEVTEAGERWQFFPQHLEWYIEKKNYPWNMNVKFSFLFFSSRNQEIVYGMDKNGDILGIKFWGGLKVCVCADISQTK